MNQVKLTYYTKTKNDEYEYHTMSGELLVGNAMFSDMVGVKNNHEGVVLIPSATLVKLEAKELDEMFLVRFNLLKDVLTHQDEEMTNKINGNGGNHLFSWEE